MVVQKNICENRILLVELVNEMRTMTSKWKDFIKFYDSQSFEEKKFDTDNESDIEILRYYTHYDESELSSIFEFAFENMMQLKNTYHNEKMVDCVFLDINDARSENYEWASRFEKNMKKFQSEHPLIKCSYGGFTGSTNHYSIYLRKSFYLDGDKHMNRILERLKGGDYKDLVSIENWKKIEKIINKS